MFSLYLFLGTLLLACSPAFRLTTAFRHTAYGDNKKLGTAGGRLHISIRKKNASLHGTINGSEEFDQSNQTASQSEHNLSQQRESHQEQPIIEIKQSSEDEHRLLALHSAAPEAADQPQKNHTFREKVNVNAAAAPYRHEPQDAAAPLRMRVLCMCLPLVLSACLFTFLRLSNRWHAIFSQFSPRRHEQCSKVLRTKTHAAGKLLNLAGCPTLDLNSSSESIASEEIMPNSSDTERDCKLDRSMYTSDDEPGHASWPAVKVDEGQIDIVSELP